VALYQAYNFTVTKSGAQQYGEPHSRKSGEARAPRAIRSLRLCAGIRVLSHLCLILTHSLIGCAIADADCFTGEVSSGADNRQLAAAAAARAAVRRRGAVGGRRRLPRRWSRRGAVPAAGLFRRRRSAPSPAGAATAAARPRGWSAAGGRTPGCVVVEGRGAASAAVVIGGGRGGLSRRLPAEYDVIARTCRLYQRRRSASF